MAKARRINISEQVEVALNISREDIQNRLEKIVEHRSGMTKEQLFDPLLVIKEYANTFTKDELLGMYIAVSSDAGFLDYKINLMIQRFQLPMEKVLGLFNEEMNDDEVVQLYKKKTEDEQKPPQLPEDPEEESFV